MYEYEVPLKYVRAWYEVDIYVACVHVTCIVCTICTCTCVYVYTRACAMYARTLASQHFVCFDAEFDVQHVCGGLCVGLGSEKKNAYEYEVLYNHGCVYFCTS